MTVMNIKYARWLVSPYLSCQQEEVGFPTFLLICYFEVMKCQLFVAINDDVHNDDIRLSVMTLNKSAFEIGHYYYKAKYTKKERSESIL